MTIQTAVTALGCLLLTSPALGQGPASQSVASGSSSAETSESRCVSEKTMANYSRPGLSLEGSVG
jgi:hypothetical protein